MVLTISSVPKLGRTVKFSESSEWAMKAAAEAMDVPKATTCVGKLFFLRRGKEVTVQVTCDTTAPGRCVRCNEDTVIAIHVDSTLTYRQTEEVDEEEVELSAQDLDIGFYQDDTLNLTDVLSEAITLATATRIVCADSVACDRRMKSLLGNEEKTVGHPAFAALDNLKY